jgi:pyrimidine deaminase RibD-like protein
MKFNEIAKEIPFEDLDQILVKLCEMIVDALATNPNAGMVGAAIVDPEGHKVLRIGEQISENEWNHAERTVIAAYHSAYGEIPEDSILITTLSPCNEHNMALRHGTSCKDLIEQAGIKEVYIGYYDPTQEDVNPDFKMYETDNPKIKEACERISQAMFKRDEEHINSR